jgi:hypothetical protein
MRKIVRNPPSKPEDGTRARVRMGGSRRTDRDARNASETRPYKTQNRRPGGPRYKGPGAGEPGRQRKDGKG